MLFEAAMSGMVHPSMLGRKLHINRFVDLNFLQNTCYFFGKGVYGGPDAV